MGVHGTDAGGAEVRGSGVSDSGRDCGAKIAPETIARIEQRWLQIGLSTFFWAGVVNASFAAGGLWAMYECQRITDRALQIERSNVAAEKMLRDLMSDVERERYRIRSEINEAAKWIQSQRK